MEQSALLLHYCLQTAVFGFLIFLAVMDARTRFVKAYWFAGGFIAVILFNLITNDTGLWEGTGLMMFGISAAFIIPTYLARMFGPADMLALLLVAFAIPFLGPFPAGIVVLMASLFIQGWAMTVSNLIYNIRDITQSRTLFEDLPPMKPLKVLYWSLMVRRRREHDRHIICGQKDAGDGTTKLSVTRVPATTDTKYVISGHPQLVYITIAFFLVWFVGLVWF